MPGYPPEFGGEMDLGEDDGVPPRGRFQPNGNHVQWNPGIGIQ